MYKLIAFAVATAGIGAFTALAGPEPAGHFKPTEELPTQSLVVFVAGDDGARVQFDKPRVVSIGDVSFLKGVVSSSVQASASKGFPAGKTFLIRVDTIVMIQDLSEQKE